MARGILWDFILVLTGAGVMVAPVEVRAQIPDDIIALSRTDYQTASQNGFGFAVSAEPATSICVSGDQYPAAVSKVVFARSDSPNGYADALCRHKGCVGKRLQNGWSVSVARYGTQCQTPGLWSSSQPGICSFSVVKFPVVGGDSLEFETVASVKGRSGDQRIASVQPYLAIRGPAGTSPWVAQPALLKPDLVAEGLFAHWDFRAQGCVVRVKLANYGKGPVPDSAFSGPNRAVVRMLENGQPWGPDQGLGSVDHERQLRPRNGTLFYDWGVFTGTKTYRVEVDPAPSRVDELNNNKANNILARELTCTPQPALTLPTPPPLSKPQLEPAPGRQPGAPVPGQPGPQPAPGGSQRGPAQ